MDTKRTVPLYDDSENYNLPKDYFKTGRMDTLEKTVEFTSDGRTTTTGTLPPPYGRNNSTGSHLYESPTVSL
jgi:hypothetical protein